MIIETRQVNWCSDTSQTSARTIKNSWESPLQTRQRCNSLGPGRGGRIIVDKFKVPDVRNICLIFAKQNKSKVDIVTRYGPDGPGIDPLAGDIFRAGSDRPPRHIQPQYTMGPGSVPGVKRLDCGANHPPSPSPKVTNGLELHRRLPFMPAEAYHGLIFTFIIVNM